MPLPPRPGQGQTGWDTYLDAVIDSYQTRIAALESAASGPALYAYTATGFACPLADERAVPVTAVAGAPLHTPTVDDWNNDGIFGWGSPIPCPRLQAGAYLAFWLFTASTSLGSLGAGLATIPSAAGVLNVGQIAVDMGLIERSFFVITEPTDILPFVFFDTPDPDRMIDLDLRFAQIA